MQLTLEHITKSYTKGKKRKNALEDFTLTLTEGVYGLLGPNGAGKSTLINIITGIIGKDSGSIAFSDGGDNSFLSHLGFMPQGMDFYRNFTAKDSSPFTYYFYMENDEDLYLMQRKRNGSVVDKTKIPLTQEQGQKIMDGHYQFLLDSDEPLLNSLYFQFTVNQLHPLYRKECTRKIFHQNRFLDEIVDIHIVRTTFEEDQDFFAKHETILKGGNNNGLRRNTRQYLNMSKPMSELLNYQNSLL